MACGCASSPQLPALFGQFEAIDHFNIFRPEGVVFLKYGESATRPLEFREIIDRAARADVIFFGEEHNDVVCNQIEAELLGGLLARGRRPALSMEFMERDTQPAVDAYLRGAGLESEFLRAARQGKNYAWSHRPLVEMAKAFRLPVVAANAPRDLVRAYRQSGKEYAQYRSELAPDHAAILPERITRGSDEYRARFFEIMGLDAPPPAGEKHGQAEYRLTVPPNLEAPPLAGEKRGQAECRLSVPPVVPPNLSPAAATADAPVMMAQPPASAPAAGAHGPLTPESVERMYQSQLLWDSAMAESVARQRERNPRQKVLHIVGVFHVKHNGGLVQAYRELRPRDRVLTIVYRGDEMGKFTTPAEEDRGAADIVIRGVRPKQEE